MTRRVDPITAHSSVRFSLGQLCLILGAILSSAWVLFNSYRDLQEGTRANQLALAGQTEQLNRIEVRVGAIEEHGRKSDEHTVARISEWSTWRTGVNQTAADHEWRLKRVEGR